MAIYLVTFLASCLMAKMASMQRKKSTYIAFSFLAILFPCLLAALRADTIGTDVGVYAKPLFEAADRSNGLGSFFSQSWWSKWRYRFVYEYEVGFALLVFCATKIFGSFSAVLFCIQLLIILPIYLALWYHRNRIPIWLGMLVFYLMNYNTTLNMMRQWIAMAFLLYGMRYLIENRPSKYFLVVLFAMLFHTSAILGVMIFFIYKYIASEKGKRTKLKVGQRTIPDYEYHVWVIAFIGILALILTKFFVWVLNVVGLQKYLYYISGTPHFMPNQIIMRLPIIVLCAFTYKRIRVQKVMLFFLSMFILELLLSQLVSIASFAGRISLYFSEYLIISLPALIKKSSSKKRNRMIICAVMFAYFVLYWWFFYVYSGESQTVPYLLR